ncbi:MAG TPA: hypothetical protein VNK43_06510 [Gemmatimonadales bacterium]|nr:hypothetical protein [Gemmatimonadales bacterium]
MPARSPASGLRSRLRRHERLLVALYLGLVASVIAILALPPARAAALGAAQGILRRWDDRWLRRLEHGEALVAAARYDEAAAYLAALDRRFPASNVRHARDKERERLLRALGTSYTALGRKARALATYESLAAFDPRNYRNHYELAVARARFLGGWALAPEARDAFAAALAINPSHLPSVRGYVDYHFDRGEFGEVVAAYERYLDAMLFHLLAVQLGDTAADVRVPVDGRWHPVEVLLPRAAGWSGPLALRSRGYPIEVRRVTVLGPQVVGRQGRDSLELAPLAWEVWGMTRTEDGRFYADSADPAIRLTVPPRPRGVERLRLELRLFKPVDPDLWAMARKSYRNRLAHDALEVARDRTVVLPSAERADAITVTWE